LSFETRRAAPKTPATKETQNMTRNEANKLLAIILETVAEASDHALGAPEGVMYAAMMNHVSLEDFNGLVTICTTTGLIRNNNHELTITAKGRAIVAKIVATRVEVTA
jgi:hypothetical protein